MAEYRDRYEAIRAARADVAAVAVDPPESSETVRQQLRLPFPILCDTRREVIATWGILNAREKGGIAKPAVFVIDRGLRVRFASVDRDVMRVATNKVVEFVASGMVSASLATRRSIVFPSLADWLRALRNTFRFGFPKH